MATSFNSNSSSSFRVGRKVKKIVSQIQRLIHEFPDCCWYDGSWWCGGDTIVTTETELRLIEYADDGVRFGYSDFYGDRHYEVIPYDAKLLSRLRNLQQKIWIGMYCIVSKGHVKKTIPAWALKRGCYPHI